MGGKKDKKDTNNSQATTNTNQNIQQNAQQEINQQILSRPTNTKKCNECQTEQQAIQQKITSIQIHDQSANEVYQQVTQMIITQQSKLLKDTIQNDINSKKTAITLLQHFKRNLQLQQEIYSNLQQQIQLNQTKTSKKHQIVLQIQKKHQLLFKARKNKSAFANLIVQQKQCDYQRLNVVTNQVETAKKICFNQNQLQTLSETVAKRKGQYTIQITKIQKKQKLIEKNKSICKFYKQLVEQYKNSIQNNKYIITQHNKK